MALRSLRLLKSLTALTLGASVQGFLWDGSAPTQFFGAQFTNGATFFHFGLDRWYGFQPNSAFLVRRSTSATLASGAPSLSPATPPPPPPPTVPEPMTLTLLAIGCAGMAVPQRGRRQ